jgi:hypothetical protein
MALNQANQQIRWKRIWVWTLGLTANAAMSYGYDFIVYPYLLAVYGLWGWLYAVIGSIVLCLGTLWFYDLTKQDWICLETIKGVRDGEAKGKLRKFFQNLATRGDWMAFVFLSLRYDPFITTVYMRKGTENYTMTARDWKIFWAGMVVSNGYWGLLVFGAIEVFQKWIAPFVPTPILNWFGL